MKQLTCIFVLAGIVNAAPLWNLAQTQEVIPNDTHFPDQWALKNTSYPGKDIKATLAWSIFQGSVGTRIAILAGGLDSTHPDLRGKVTYNRLNLLPLSTNGTAIAGIAAAKTNNSAGIAGVDWNAKLLNYDFRSGEFNDIRDRINDAVADGVDILDIDAYSGDFSDGEGVTRVQIAAENAYKNNKVMVVPAGDRLPGESPAPVWPASFGRTVLAVNSLTREGFFASYSNYGTFLDLMAPGGDKSGGERDIRTTTWNGFAGYDFYGGTSAAAAHVTGVASLLKGFKPNLANDDISNIVNLSADDLHTTGYDTLTGWGILNAHRALNVLQPPNIFLQPSVTGGSSHSVVAMQQTFNDIGTLPNGVYFVDRHEVRTSVTFPVAKPFLTSPSPWSDATRPWPAAWGRGSFSTGWSASNPNRGLPFCEVVPGTITSTGCVLRTFVYWVKANIIGQTINKWVPAPPSQVVLAYSALGEPQMDPPTLNAAYPELAYICSPDSGCRWRVKGVKLNCSENNINEEGLVVERKDATNNTWQDVIALPPNATTYTDTSNLMGSQTYTYRIRCFSGGSAVYSNEVAIRTPPKPPANLRATVGSITTYCIADGMGGSETGEFEATSGGGIELLGPPGYCTYKTNAVRVAWDAPANQNPAVPITSYRVDAYWYKNRTVTVCCFTCGSNTQLWPTFERSVTTTSNWATVCAQQPDTLYEYYVTAFDALGDSSFLWIKNLQHCPPDSQLVVSQPTWAYPGGFCVNPCCGLGKATASTGQEGSSALPTEFTLGANFPNPFNPTTTIRYALPQAAKVELRVFNILGQVVRKLVNEEKPAGYHQALWDGRDEEGRPVSTGIYLYQIRAGDFIETKKMQLIK